MAMELKLDGRTLGTIGADGAILDASGKPVQVETAKNDRPQIEVPLYSRNNEGSESDDGADEDADENADDGTDEDDDSGEGNAPVSELKRQNTLLLQQIKLLTDLVSRRPDERTDVQSKVYDLIPDDLSDEQDPLKVARTVKQLTKLIGELDSKVTRLDTHTGYEAYNKVLEKEKARHSVFNNEKNPRLSSMANRLLDAEIKTNPSDPITEIVSRVVRDMREFSGSSKAKALKNKTDVAKKLPSGTLRSSSGAPPTISVNRPRNLTEAKMAYQAWRAANNRAK